MSREIGARKARLLREGVILAAVEDWCEGTRSDLRRVHPYTVKAYARTLGRVRAHDVAVQRYVLGKLSDAHTLAHLDQELDERTGL